jgi:hypothetical protein
MNTDLEALILVYDIASSSRDLKAVEALRNFEARLDDVVNQHSGVSRGLLRRSVLMAHRQWALKQDNKPPAIPPRA